MKNEFLDYKSKKNILCLLNFVMDKIFLKKERMKKKEVIFWLYWNFFVCYYFI